MCDIVPEINIPESFRDIKLDKNGGCIVHLGLVASNIWNTSTQNQEEKANWMFYFLSDRAQQHLLYKLYSHDDKELYNEMKKYAKKTGHMHPEHITEKFDDWFIKRVLVWYKCYIGMSNAINTSASIWLKLHKDEFNDDYLIPVYARPEIKK